MSLVWQADECPSIVVELLHSKNYNGCNNSPPWLVVGWLDEQTNTYSHIGRCLAVKPESTRHNCVNKWNMPPAPVLERNLWRVADRGAYSDCPRLRLFLIWARHLDPATRTTTIKQRQEAVNLSTAACNRGIRLKLLCIGGKGLHYACRALTLIMAFSPPRLATFHLHSLLGENNIVCQCQNTCFQGKIIES